MKRMGQRTNKRIPTLLLCLAALLITLGCGLEELYLGLYIDSHSEELKTPAGSDESPVTFTIEEGQSVAEVAGNLKAHGLIKDTELFRRYVQYKGLDASIQAGTYRLRQTMTIPEIATALQQAYASEQTVTIPEGKRLEEVASLVAEQTTITSEEFLQLAQYGWQTSNLVAEYPLLATVPVSGTLEGFLFPDTYRLPFDASARDLVKRMLDNFTRQVTPEIAEGFIAQGVTFYEGMVLASIVEREAVVAEERPLIAGVYLNRLHDGWLLNADPTVQYALGYRPEENTWWKRQLYFGDLEVDSPYNTYRYRGLPPTPIASPGISAIRATALPEESDYYFFMRDCDRNDGSHVFAVTEEEHLANFARCN